MFSINPFAELSATISPEVMQWYVIVMAIFVAGGTLFDVIHKGSAKYFFQDIEAKKARARNQVSGGEKMSLRIQAVLVDVLTSAEFGMTQRRIAHILTFWGFTGYVIATVVMVFGYPTPDMATPAWAPGLWYLGAAMVMVGGYWYWFFMRVDVAKEGNPPFRLVRADLFVVSLVLSVTFGFVWGLLQASGGAWTNLFLALYLLATTVLFVGVPWSKFSHMFYKSAAAMQRRIEEAEGSTNQPPPADRPLL
ncbi:MAG: adenylyl-sulfate reductase [Thiotrichales bacterium]|nr:adenylyl-sulfate reductase [Thiotrichales bacterium]